MSGTITCINRAPAGTAAGHGEARLIMQGDGHLVAPDAPDGNRSARYATRASSEAGRGTKAVRRAADRLHGGIAGAGSTESPHVVRPVPENH
ncbi:hypothetical protein ACFC1R_27100 [Kitasatospora sp. NPDC056138]|uniref:hypothetical protein n=1 Tax=Kitasatospora sp. NPDC056138 TaxID=3345724 RepID=UPI0035D8BBDF